MTETEEILYWFWEKDLRDSLSWGFRAGTNEIFFWVNCSDVFYWGTADGEDITAADLPDLEQAYQDLIAASDPDNYLANEVYAPELWAARKRGMRPQRPWWYREKFLEPIKELFKAAGPERDPSTEG